MPGVAEHLRHVLGVGDADAEAQRPHRAGSMHLVPQLSQDDRGAGVVAGVESGQLGVVVAGRVVQLIARRSVPSATAK